MGPTNRFFIFFAVIAIGAVVGGQAILSRFPLNQAFLQMRLGMPASGQVTSGFEESAIPLEWLGGVWVARVELNDMHEARLVVDTGATFTIISEDLAFDAGIQIDFSTPPIQLTTAGGRVQAEMGLARKIRVGDAERNDVPVVVHTIPNLSNGVDGLLGLSFFDQFLVRLDQSKQQLHISVRK